MPANKGKILIKKMLGATKSKRQESRKGYFLKIRAKILNSRRFFSH